LELGFTELLVLLVIAIVILGPEKLPEFARTLGKFWYEFQKWREMVQKEIAKEVEPVKESVEEMGKGLEETIEAAKKTVTIESGKGERTLPKAGYDVKSTEVIDDDLRSLAIELGVNVEGRSKKEVIEEIREKIRGLKSEQRKEERRGED